MNKIKFSVAVFSGELRSRIEMTAKCINSINFQEHKSLQKILVNGNSPPHQTGLLKSMDVDLSDWEIIDFPVDCMDMEDSGKVHKFLGAAALHVVTGDFFFALNDDDFIASDFFSRIANKLSQYPDAGAAIGLRVEYNHATEEFGPRAHPTNSFGLPRPEYENGLNVVRELFFKGNLSYGPSLGFQPVLKTELIKTIGSDFFYKGFYPDHAPYFQIVSRTNMVFDKFAEMYWGLHPSQDHSKWDSRIFWNCDHEGVFNSFMKENFRIFRENLPRNKVDLRNLEIFYSKKIASYSLFSISSRYFNKDSQFYKFRKNSHSNFKFPLFKHLKIMIKRPIITIWLILEVLRIKFLKILK